MFDLRARQQLNRGYSDGLARGTELVLTPLVAGGIGWLLDGWFGTGPVLAVSLGIFGVVGIFAKLWLGYDREMVAAEAGKPWTRGRTSAVASTSDTAAAPLAVPSPEPGERTR